MVNCVSLCGPLPTGKVLRSNRKVQEPSVTVPLASLPPESNVTGPTLVPLKLPNCKVNACPCGNPNTAARSGPAPPGNAKDRLVRSLGAAATEAESSSLLHPRTVSIPMTTTRAIHCAMRRGRAICETGRGQCHQLLLCACASWRPALPYSPPARMSKMRRRTDGSPHSKGPGICRESPGSAAPFTRAGVKTTQKKGIESRMGGEMLCLCSGLCAPRVESDSSGMRPHPRQGYGLLLEEKNPDRWQLTDIERSRDQIAVSYSIKDAYSWCRRGRIVHRHV